MSKVKLVDVCDFQGGSQPPKSEWISEPKDGYIRMLQIRDFTQSRNSDKEYVKLTGTTKTCTADDILIARYGASIGKILTGLSGAYNVAIMKTIPNTNTLSKKYLLYYLLSDTFQSFICNVGSRAAQAGFNKDELSALSIRLPSLDIQRQIAATLDKATQTIDLCNAILEKLDLLVKARFVEMFGDPVENPKNWDMRTLCELTTKIGSGATPKGGRDTYGTEGISLIRSMNVHNGYFEHKDLAHISDEQAEKLDNVTIQENDVLLNITGASVARSCIVPANVLPARVNQHVCIIRCKSCVLPLFVNSVLIDDHYQCKLWEIAGSGATREAITKQQIEMLSIIVPPLELQKQFAAFVEKNDRTKAAVKQVLAKAETLKKALMQEYFG